MTDAIKNAWGKIPQPLKWVVGLIFLVAIVVAIAGCTPQESEGPEPGGPLPPCDEDPATEAPSCDGPPTGNQ